MRVFDRRFAGQRGVAPANKSQGGAAKVLVASLSPAYAEPARADAAVYRQRFEATSEAAFETVEALVAAVRQGGFTVVHLFCAVGPDGRVAGSAVDGTQLIAACAAAGVRLLWIA